MFERCATDSVPKVAGDNVTVTHSLIAFTLSHALKLTQAQLYGMGGGGILRLPPAPVVPAHLPAQHCTAQRHYLQYVLDAHRGRRAPSIYCKTSRGCCWACDFLLLFECLISSAAHSPQKNAKVSSWEGTQSTKKGLKKSRKKASDENQNRQKPLLEQHILGYMLEVECDSKLGVINSFIVSSRLRTGPSSEVQALRTSPVHRSQNTGGL